LVKLVPEPILGHSKGHPELNWAHALQWTLSILQNATWQAGWPELSLDFLEIELKLHVIGHNSVCLANAQKIPEVGHDGVVEARRRGVS
jgi:hypothetical protein